jgi:hypothetical protein
MNFVHTRTRPKKGPKFPFVLEELQESALAPRVRTRAMFGSHAVYIDRKIVFILRRKDDPKTLRDNGIWVATMPEHNASLLREFPALRRIELFAARGQTGFTGWLNLPDSDDSFEESALALCRLVIAGDPRIGKVPKSRSPRPATRKPRPRRKR